jgi:hypothetical protein
MDSLDDELRRLRQENADRNRDANNAEATAVRNAAAGAVALQAIGAEIAAVMAREKVAEFGRVHLTPRRFHAQQFRVALMPERAWIFRDIAVTRDGWIGGATKSWQPGAPWTPQHMKRIHRRVGPGVAVERREVAHLEALLRDHHLAGLYGSLEEIPVLGSAPTGYQNKDDERSGVWFDGTHLLHGTASRPAPYRPALLRLAAEAIEGGSSEK